MRKTQALLPLLTIAYAIAACGRVDYIVGPDDETGGTGSNGSGGRPALGGPIGRPSDPRVEGDDPSEVLGTLTSEVLTPLPRDERVACGDRPIRDKYIPSAADQNRAQELLSDMTIEQKLIQLSGVEVDYFDSTRWEDLFRSEDDEGLGIRGYRYRDGNRGANLEEQGNPPSVCSEPGCEVPSTQNFTHYATSFPVAAAQGASFDVNLVQRVGQAIGDEALASGASIALSPSADLVAHPFWGRAQEAFGEDPFQVGRMATAFTIGVQTHIASCVTHFLGVGVEVNRNNLNLQVDDQALHEVYARPFEMAVRDGGVACVMTAYNAVNGTGATLSHTLLTDTLRKDMRFQGFVLSDLWALPADNVGQGPTEPPNDEPIARKALLAGLDVEMPWPINFKAIPRLIEAEPELEGVVDQAVLNVLEQKLRFKSAMLDEPVGLNPASTTFDAETSSIMGTEEHIVLAREVAEKSAVLLKNDAMTLPIRGASKVVILGVEKTYVVSSDGSRERTFRFAEDAALGARGSSRVVTDPTLTVGPFQGLQMAAPEGVTVTKGTTAEAAAAADFVVVVVGLTPADEGEEWVGPGDRESLDLDERQAELVQDAAALGKPMAVIVEASGPVSMPWLSDVPAVVMAFYPGQRGGEALGRLLFGQVNFSGKLPVSWPSSLDQLPEFVGSDSKAVTREYFVGYRRFDSLELEPLFPFGHGLSYSAFEYKALQIPCETVTDDGLIEVEVDVRNAGEVAGEEIVMAFASYPDSSARRPNKELKGFARVRLAAGETRRVTIPIRVSDLTYWDEGKNGWALDSGRVQISVGPDAAHLPLQETFVVE